MVLRDYDFMVVRDYDIMVLRNYDTTATALQDYDIRYYEITILWYCGIRISN